MTKLSTIALHTGYDLSDHRGAAIPPIHLSTTFEFGNPDHYEYSRSGNPTRDILEKTLAALDDAQFGLAFSSGSAVLANVMALLHSGDEVLFSADAYGGTYRYIVQVLAGQGVSYRIADFTDLKRTAEIIQKHPIKLIWVETPTNPLLKVADITALSKLAKKQDAILVVDNTFATPVIQKPLALGADIVVYSTTKYINGHSDSVGGSLATNNAELFERLQFLQNAMGAILSPFDSWLTLRGLRTLELRMERHVSNAKKVAELLRGNDKVKQVYYPGYFTGEQGKIVAKQMTEPGAIISVEIDDIYDVQQFLKALRYFPLAESLGGAESLIDHPASMTHAAIPKEEREKIGLRDGLFRISVGIENSEDLLADITQALDSLK
jgi:cystathionine beta-lyase/cystathionine gamma-synthase